MNRRNFLQFTVAVSSLNPIDTLAQDTTQVEVELFVAENTDGLATDTCELTWNGSPASLEARGSEGERTLSFQLPQGQNATLNMESFEVRGCVYRFSIDLPPSGDYTYSVAGYEMNTISYTGSRGTGRLSLYRVDEIEEALKNRGSTNRQSTTTNSDEGPIDPIAFVPDVSKVIQRSFVSSQGAKGQPLVVVVTSYEYKTTESSDSGFVPACEDLSQWFIDVGGASTAYEVPDVGDSRFAVGTPDGTSVVAVVREGRQLVTIFAGGTVPGTDIWLRAFLDDYPFGQGIALPNPEEISGDWTVRWDQVDVTEYAQTPINEREK